MIRLDNPLFKKEETERANYYADHLQKVMHYSLTGFKLRNIFYNPLQKALHGNISLKIYHDMYFRHLYLKWDGIDEKS